jgi:hypothetical protein
LGRELPWLVPAALCGLILLAWGLREAASASFRATPQEVARAAGSLQDPRLAAAEHQGWHSARNALLPARMEWTNGGAFPSSMPSLPGVGTNLLW